MDSSINFIDVAALTQAQKNAQLLEAAEAGDVDKVERCLEAGAAIDATTDRGTALIMAALGGHTAVVAKLIASGANKEHVDQSGETSLIWAARYGHTSVVERLIAAGANKEATNEFGETALMRAAGSGHAAVVAKLIAANANIEATDQFGDTALIRAARNGHTAVVAQLIEAGANIEATDQFGQTALMWAARNGRTALVAQLIEAGANIEATDEMGLTALSFASRLASRIEKEQGIEKEQDAAFLILSAMSPASRAEVAIKSESIKNVAEHMIDDFIKSRIEGDSFGMGKQLFHTTAILLAVLGMRSRAPEAKLAIKYERMASDFERQVCEIHQFFSDRSRCMVEPVLAIMLGYMGPSWVLDKNMLQAVNLASEKVREQEAKALPAQASVATTCTGSALFRALGFLDCQSRRRKRSEGEHLAQAPVLVTFRSSAAAEEKNQASADKQKELPRKNTQP